MRKLFILLAGAAVITTAACNTLAGMGRDTQAAGKAVTNTAEDAKK
jgi:predicted small secreted protein